MRGVPIGLRRRARALELALNVGDYTSVGAAPAGFAQVFKGWNVWDLWQSLDPIEGLAGAVWNAGMSPDRRLQVWVENEIKERANGTAVADPANPAALRGDQIQIVPNAAGLAQLETRASIPALAGGVQLGEKDSEARKVTVRFFNRGQEAIMPWPHDENFLLDVVYQPSSSNALTSGTRPDSLGGAAGELADSAATALKVVAIGGAVVLGVVLVAALVNSSKKAAA
jgi:hypothetical protein